MFKRLILKHSLIPHLRNKGAIPCSNNAVQSSGLHHILQPEIQPSRKGFIYSPSYSFASSGGDNQDLYQILGVPKDASADDIKAAYRKEAMRTHPDRGGNVEEFKKLQAAYQVLGDPDKKQQYDNFGPEGVRDSFDDDFDFSSIFGNMFRGGPGGGGARRPRKMKRVVQEIRVTLEDIYRGGSKQVKVQRQRNCGTCSGKGGKNPKKCVKCKGSGVIQKITQVGHGMVHQTSSPCGACGGEGTIIEPADKCQTCKGNKVKTEEKTLELSIQRGTPNDYGQTFTYEGHEMPGVMAGDVRLNITVEPHKVFERNGADLYVKKKITLYEALTGTAFHINHLNGSKILVMTEPNEIIEPGTVRELKGKGMPFYLDPTKFGNLYVTFDVEFPKKNEVKNTAELGKILPIPPNQVTDANHGEVCTLEKYNAAQTNPNPKGGRSKPRNDENDEDDGDNEGGPERVQCANQ